MNPIMQKYVQNKKPLGHISLPIPTSLNSPQVQPSHELHASYSKCHQPSPTSKPPYMANCVLCRMKDVTKLTPHEVAQPASLILEGPLVCFSRKRLLSQAHG